MKARPILMSAPMIRALLDGRKTQTRRILKPQPLPPVAIWVMEDHWWMPKAISDAVRQQFVTTWPNAIRCPYGQPGDLLWVRESWQLHSRATDLAKVVYRASEAASHSEFHELIPVSQIGCMQPKPFQQGWRSSIHMPRWASRLTLEITGVRVERLQYISREDALAEGVEGGCGPGYDFAQHAYQRLWESINGPNSWAANPWVFVLSFRVHRQNIDHFLSAPASGPSTGIADTTATSGTLQRDPAPFTVPVAAPAVSGAIPEGPGGRGQSRKGTT